MILILDLFKMQRRKHEADAEKKTWSSELQLRPQPFQSPCTVHLIHDAVSQKAER